MMVMSEASFGDRCTVTHRQSYVSRLQCRCIVGTVTSNSHHLVLALQRFYQTLLIHWTGARDNLEVKDSIIEFLV